MTFRISLVVAALWLPSVPLFAHHSAAAEYVSQLSGWHGVITRFSWMNPHTLKSSSMRTKDATGNTVKYVCEGSAPSGLMRQRLAAHYP